jgi:hypothetical protein
MQPELAPPGFWRWPGDQPVLIDGIEIESRVPTRFFQTVDSYPPEWGRLNWRLALNRIVSGRAAPPVFRTFYSGIEWNLNHPDYRWFLSAWFKWEGPGPDERDALPGPIVEGDTALFAIASSPKMLFLRSRVDARDRRRIAEDFRAQPEQRPKSDPGVISIDDLL